MNELQFKHFFFTKGGKKKALFIYNNFCSFYEAACEDICFPTFTQLDSLGAYKRFFFFEINSAVLVKVRSYLDGILGA